MESGGQAARSDGNQGWQKSGHWVRRLFAFVAIIALVSITLAIAPPVMAASVGLSANSGAPGDTINVTGIGFSAGNTYYITFAPGTAYEYALVGVTVLTGTSFSQPIVIPQAPYGNFNIVVYTTQGNFSLPFTVTPAIDLSVNSGHVGDTIVLNGGGFRGGTGVTVYFGTTSILALTTDTSGTLPASTFQVPAVRSGTYSVYGTDGIASSASYQSLYFTVLTQVTASAQTVTVGDHVTVAGSGYEYNSPLTFYWDGQVIGSVQISSSNTGTFSIDFTIPASNAGTHSLRINDATSRQANVIFTVTPGLTLTPNSGVPGNQITVTGRGFHYNSAITITFNGVTMVTQPTIVTTDSNGGFTASFTVPSVVGGSYIVRGSDGVSAISTTFTVVSAVNLTPATGYVGTTLQVSGTGFTPAGSVSVSYDGQVVATVTADTTGSFTASFKVPVSKAGQHIIAAADLARPGIQTTATFTISATPPPTPNLLSPDPGSQATTTPTFTWSEVTDPNGITYSLQVARDAGFTQLVLDKQGLTSNSYQVAQADAFSLVKKSNSYYWRVKAVDLASNESPWAAAFTFYTQDSTPPSVPALISPPNNTQTSTLPTFTWSEVTDPSGVSYTLQVARDAGFTSLALYKQGLSSATYQTAQAEAFALVKNLSPYYWRVMAVDGVGNQSDWTAAFTFYTQDSTPPPAPTALKPESGSTQGTQTFFEWTEVTDPSGVTYELQVALDSSFSQLVVDKTGLDKPQYRLTKDEQLSSATGKTQNAYYWRVRAIDGAANQSNWSNINLFTVRSLLQSGWPLYLAFVIGGLLLLAIGVFVGMRLKPRGETA